MMRRIDTRAIINDWRNGMTHLHIMRKHHVNRSTVYAVGILNTEGSPDATDDQMRQVIQSVFNRSQSGKMYSWSIRDRVMIMQWEQGLRR